MSIGQSTYFCENGHMVYDTFEDEVFYEEYTEKCLECGSTNIRSEYEWHDPVSYGPHVVPHEPLRMEPKYVVVQPGELFWKSGETYFDFQPGNLYRKFLVPIYDVKILFEENVNEERE